jgi:CheY-like chemotaxis protein
MMNRQGRILVVDDLAKWRRALSSALQRGNFHVDTATTASEAMRRLEENAYHLLVLDIRMEALDPSNEEGMDLLRMLAEQGLDKAIGIIILSAYGTKEQMREAFMHSHVIDFQSKDDFEKREFLKQVQQLFEERIDINLGLAVHWLEVSGPEQAVTGIEVAGRWLKQGAPLQTRMAAELDDLLCRLFRSAESVLVRPLAPGHSGAGVLWAQPFFVAGSGQPVVVKFGDRHAIEREYRNFKEYVEPYIGGGRSTTVRNLRYTPLLGGISYSLLGSVSDRFQDFGNFYRQADLDEIPTVLTRLFLDTCGAWYASPGRLQPYDLTADYQQLLRFSGENLEQACYERLKSVQGKAKLQFKSLSEDRQFTNPILTLEGPHLLRPTYVCTAHGDSNANNILVNDIGHTWLINFSDTGPGHILRDVASLDSSIRLQLLASNEASLDERMHLEETLLQCNRFSALEQLKGKLLTENHAILKAYTTALHLRSLAGQLVVQNPADDMSEYYIALFYYALNTIRYYSLSTVQREHALLSASLLGNHLGLC